MKSIIESRSNQNRTLNTSTFLGIDNQPTDTDMNTDMSIDMCMKCFKYPSIINNIYCISCLQCEDCMTILSATDDDCPHCRKKKVVDTNKQTSSAQYFSKEIDISSQNPYVVDYIITDKIITDKHNSVFACRDKCSSNILILPKCILRYIIMKFLDIKSIKTTLLTVEEMNILDDFCKNMLDLAQRGFIWNCSRGNLDVAKWLYSRGANIRSEGNIAFKLACENGHLNVAYWLYTITTDIQANKQEIFSSVCKNGYIDVAQWLCSIVDIDIHAREEYAFISACQYGHIDLAKWLHSLGGINIHANDEYAFKSACKNGHINVAQWLYSPGEINIHSDNDYAFRTVCKNDYIDIAQWLRSIDE